MLIAAEETEPKCLPGWLVFTRQGEGWQAVATQAIKEGPQEMGPDCGEVALAAVLADLQRKEKDAPGA